MKLGWGHNVHISINFLLHTQMIKLFLVLLALISEN